MSLFLPISIFLVSSFFGINVLSAGKLFREKVLVFAAGTVMGLVATTTLTYLLTAFMLLSQSSIIIVLVLELAFAYAINSRSKSWKLFTDLPLDKTAFVLLAVLFVVFGLITQNILIDDISNDEGLSTGTINAYGDIGFHMANITNLAYSQTIPPADPILSGNRLTYPFFSNFFSAILLIGGAGYSQAINWPAFVLIPITLILLYCLTHHLTNSKKAALIVVLLFTLGGGTLGWIRITEDLSAPYSSVIELFANLPRNYSGHSDDVDGFRLVNPVISLLIPQRSFMFGMPMAFIILLLLIRNKRANHSLSFLLAGLLAGLLPLFHAHTVIVLVPLILLFLIRNPNRDWRIFFSITFLVGIPGVLYYLTSEAAASTAPHIQLGWMAKDSNIIIFWLKNTGLLVPITVLGLFIPAPKNTKLFALVGLFIFLAANIWLFAAWEWDNTKLFVYSTIFTLPLIACTIIYAWQKGSYYIRGVVIAILIFHVISGALDVLRLTLPDIPTWQEWDNDSIAMAESIRASTSRYDTILNAPYHNSPAALSGRSVYLGFPGHVWTHGGNYFEREEAIKKFYNGEIDVLPEHQPQYIVVGPVERTYYPDLIIQPNWQLIEQNNQYELYRLPSPPS